MHKKKTVKKNMAGRFSYFLLSALFTVVLIIVVRTVMFSYHPVAAVPCLPTDLDYIHADEAARKRFQKAITFKTVSYDVGNYNRQELRKFLEFILEGKKINFIPDSVFLH